MDPVGILDVVPPDHDENDDDDGGGGGGGDGDGDDDNGNDVEDGSCGTALIRHSR